MGGVVVALVELMLERWACIWPMTVASERGAYCVTCLEVNAGQESRYPALMALVHVERTGENRAA